MKSTQVIEKNKKSIPIISILLGIAVIATAAAYIIFKVISERTYRRKWEDYDDCGLA